MTASKIPNLPALDVLRASIALLGIIFHASLSYFVGNALLNLSWPTNPQHQNLFFDYLLVWIHTFRMPAFFLLSGFFTYFIYQKYGLRGLFINRSRRVLIPFLVLWLLMNVSALISWTFLKFVMGSPKLPSLFSQIESLGPFWFLYDLMILNCLTAILLMIKMPAPLCKLLQFIYEKRWLSLSIFYTASVIIMASLKVWIIPPEITLIPNLLLFYYGLFFYFGWIIASHLPAYERTLQAGWRYYFLAALLAFGVYMTLLLYLPTLFLASSIAILTYNIVAWGMILGLIGLLLQKLNRKIAFSRYLADSAYWIYISHLPVIILLQIIFLKTNLSSFLQFVLICIMTTSLCLLTYQLFIRKRKIFRYIDSH